MIDELDVSLLLPENQSRLRLYLARDAYRRRDWPLLETYLAQLKELEVGEETAENYRLYLSAELARHHQDLKQASVFFSSLDDNFKLHIYAQFNLAVMFAQQGNERDAIGILEDMLQRDPRDYAEHVLLDRGRIALSELYLTNNRFDAARQVLAGVSVKHQYGPYALAQLARLEMQQQRYEGAVQVWQYLVTEYPWHRAATHSVSGLGYALQESEGEEAAYAVYTDGLNRIQLKRAQLGSMQLALNGELQDAEGFKSGSEDFLLWLNETFGHDDWLAWFASAEVQHMAARWHGLETAYESLLLDQDRLEQLLVVDQEQQRRIRAANLLIAEDQMEDRLQVLQQKLAQRKNRLLDLEVSIDQDLQSYANESERQLLSDIDRLKESAVLLGSHAETLSKRIARLEGVVRFGVFERLPATRQKLISALEQRLLLAQRAEERLQRLRAAALRQPESVGARIVELTEKHQALQQETLMALGVTRQQLLAALSDYVDVDQALLAAQQNGLQYDITRLIDRRLAAGGVK